MRERRPRARLHARTGSLVDKAFEPPRVTLVLFAIRMIGVLVAVPRLAVGA